MVASASSNAASAAAFQYSLCRVVLMVQTQDARIERLEALSVLALSSRFDGPGQLAQPASLCVPFSTRSVESF